MESENERQFRHEDLVGQGKGCRLSVSDMTWPLEG